MILLPFISLTVLIAFKKKKKRIVSFHIAPKRIHSYELNKERRHSIEVFDSFVGQKKH